MSTAGYALGYLGCGLLMAFNLLTIQKPHLFGIADAAAAMRISFLTVAVWWLAFSIPMFRRVPEPPRRVDADEAGPPRTCSWSASRGCGETCASCAATGRRS